MILIGVRALWAAATPLAPPVLRPIEIVEDADFNPLILGSSEVKLHYMGPTCKNIVRALQMIVHCHSVWLYHEFQ